MAMATPSATADRTRESATTTLLEALQPYLERAGITRVAVVTGLDTIGIPVVMVTRPLGRSLSVAQGKGQTLAQAKVSGIIEAMEHYHAESSTLELRYGSSAEVSGGDDALDLTRLVAHAQQVSMEAPLLWTPGVSLLDFTRVWVPHDAVHLDMRVPGLATRSLISLSSNGLGAGSTLEQASCHALYELIERHQAAAFYQRSASAQADCRVAIGSIVHAGCRELLGRFEAARVLVGIWDLSDCLGIPCFLCDVVDAEDNLFRRLPRARGFGCHLDKHRALTAAMCEAAQSRLTAIGAVRDDIDPHELALARSPASLQRARAQLTTQAGTLRSFDVMPTRQREDDATALSELVQTLHKAGVEQMACVDLSKVDWPLRVVRVVVPGLAGYTRYEPVV